MQFPPPGQGDGESYSCVGDNGVQPTAAAVDVRAAAAKAAAGAANMCAMISRAAANDENFSLPKVFQDTLRDTRNALCESHSLLKESHELSCRMQSLLEEKKRLEEEEMKQPAGREGALSQCEREMPTQPMILMMRVMVKLNGESFSTDGKGY